eukprot:g33841.t1
MDCLFLGKARGDGVCVLINIWCSDTVTLMHHCSQDLEYLPVKGLNLNEYATTVTDFISKCVEDCMTKKLIRMFPNRKPWMSGEIYSLLRSGSEAFKWAALTYTGNP